MPTRGESPSGRVLKQDFRKFFESSSALQLVVTPSFEIVAASDAYLRATHTERDEIVGKLLFHVFPENPEDPTGARNLRASLERVLAEKVTDVMAVQKYDIPRPAAQGGGFEERYWSPVNSPVFGRHHEVSFIIHRVEDVTELVRLKEEQVKEARSVRSLRERADHMEMVVFLRAQELQEVNRQLIEAKDQVERLLASINDGFLSVDRNWLITYCNAREAEFLGADVDELIGRDLRTVLDGSEQAMVECFTSAMETNEPVALEFYSPRQDRWFHKRIYAASEGVSCYSTDVTARKETERRLAFEHAITRILAASTSFDEAVPEILKGVCDLLSAQLSVLWLVDTTHETLRCASVHRCNEAFEALRFEEESRRLVVARGASLPGRTWLARKPSWVLDLSKDSGFTRGKVAAEAGLVSAFAFPVSTGDEFFGVVEFFTTRPFRADPPLVQVMADLGDEIGQFIQRRRSESERSQLSSIVESSSDSIISLTTDGRIVTWNRGAERVYGYAADEMIGHSFVDLLPENGRDEFRANRQRVLGGEMVEDYETVRLHQDGWMVHVESTLSPIRDSFGTVTGISSIERDVTQRKVREEIERKNRELEAENRRVEEASKIKSEFFANLSHELRSPLNGILGFSELLLEEKTGSLTPDQREFVKDIHTSGSHLQCLINNMLDLSKVEAGRMAVQFKAFSAAKALEEVCAGMGSLALRRGIQITQEVDLDPPVVILDLIMFKQILCNLLSNAIKFNRDGGRIDVSITPAEREMFCVTVSDTGIGIAEGDQEHLFEEFYQVPNPGVAEPGTGLGLAVTKKLVELHGGSISVSSELDHGTTFKVLLPVKYPQRGAGA